nr:ATP-binding protein [uncultured Flavobacterium sp.]
MQSNLLTQKFELFNVCPFLICVTNRKGELVFMNQFAKNYFSESSIANSIHIYDRIMELFPESYQSIKEIVDLALINNENIEKTVPIINNDNLINISFTVSIIDDCYYSFFFKFLPHLNQDLSHFISNTLINNANEAIVCYTLEGRIITWNTAAEHMFGFRKINILGKKIHEIPFSFKMIEEEDVLLEAVLLKTYRNKKVEKQILINNEIQHVEVTTKPIYNPSNEIVGISKSFTNITSYVTSSQLLHKHVENLKYLNDIWESLSQNLDVQNILQIVTDVTTKFSGAAYGAFFYNSLSADGEAMRLFTLSGANREDFMQLGMPRNTEIFKKTFSSKQAFVTSDVTQNPDYGHNAPYHGLPKGHLAVRSYMSIPVISMTGENLGSLLFGHPEPNKFSQEHIKMMQSIASQSAIALENSRLLESVKTLSSKKDVFITMAGHELRSPLTIIKGFIQILDEVNEDDNLDIYIEKVIEQVDKLNLLIDDLLDVGQIESGEIILNKTSFSLSDLINETIETISYAQNTHKISFVGDFPNQIINADRRRLQQVLSNLIYNGIKYSPTNDEIIVQAKIENNEAIVKVIDFGIGIPEKHIPNIFDRFYRVPTNENISGIGIGLYICSKIVKKHNGTLSVNSVINEGSEFIFKIPQYIKI